MGIGRRRKEKLKIFKFNVMILCTKIVIVVSLTETMSGKYLYKKISVTLNSLLEREGCVSFLTEGVNIRKQATKTLKVNSVFFFNLKMLFSGDVRVVHVLCLCDKE